MQAKSYYQYVYKRIHGIEETVLATLLFVTSWPRLVLEVFTRKNFGERYFSMGSVILILLVLIALPIGYTYVQDQLAYIDIRADHFTVWGFLKKFFTWYSFLAAFLYASIERQREINRLPSVFDFARVSVSTGDINPWFYTHKLGNKPVDERMISIILEPALFLAAGILLWLIGQPIGIILTICSLIYSLSYRVAYLQGDHYMMDFIDIQIFNEEFGRVVVDGLKSSETRGVTFKGRRPTAPEFRRQVAEAFTRDEETVIAL